MNKKISILLISLIFTLFIISSFMYVSCYHQGAEDNTYYIHNANDIVEVDNNYIVAGCIKIIEETFVPSGCTYMSEAYETTSDSYIVGLDQNGNELWNAYISDMITYSLTDTNNQDIFILAGRKPYTEKILGFYDDYEYLGYIMKTVKFNKNTMTSENIAMDQIYGKILSANKTSDTGFIVSGRASMLKFKADYSIDWTYHYTLEEENNYNADSKSYNFYNNEIFDNSSIQTSDGGFVISQKIYYNYYDKHINVIKLDSEGAEVWVYKNEGHSNEHRIKELKNKHLLVQLGSTIIELDENGNELDIHRNIYYDMPVKDFDIIDDNNIVVLLFSTSYHIVKYDITNEVTTDIYNPEDSNINYNRIKYTSDNNIILPGYYDDGDTTHFITDKLDMSGSLLWEYIHRFEDIVK